MRIVWDETKRISNLRKHRLDFADLTIEFFASATVYPGKGKRLVAVGFMEMDLITVVFIYLGTEAISVISMRPSSKKERNW